jgi:hypothetical protein
MHRRFERREATGTGSCRCHGDLQETLYPAVVLTAAFVSLKRNKVEVCSSKSWSIVTGAQRGSDSVHGSSVHAGLRTIFGFMMVNLAKLMIVVCPIVGALALVWTGAESTARSKTVGCN